jgi:hypothetical protein
MLLKASRSVSSCGLTRPGGRWVPDGRPEHLREACEGSLKRLKVERIDLYQLHKPDPRIAFEDSVWALAELREEGKISHVLREGTRGCKSPISKGVSFLRLALRCTVLRSRWCQEYVNLRVYC